MLDNVIHGFKPFFLDTIFKFVPRDNSVVFLFGSLAEGRASRSADIDIGVFCLPGVDREKMAMMKAELTEKIKTLRDIDVIDFSENNDTTFLKVALSKIDVWHRAGAADQQFATLVDRVKHLK